MTGNARNMVNLIPTARRRKLARKVTLRRWTRAWYAVAVVTLLIVIAGRLHFAHGSNDALQNRLDQFESQYAQMTERARTWQPMLVEQVQKVKAAEAVAQQPDWAILLALLADQAAQSIKLNEIRVAVTQDDDKANADATSQRPRVVVEIEALAAAMEDGAQFAMALERTKLFDRVRLLRSTREDHDNTQRVRFHMRCVIAATPGQGEVKHEN